MINFYKINTEGYPEVGSGKTLPQGYTEFTVDENGVYSPAELNDALDALKLEEDKAKQIAEATKYLSDTDWVIVKITEMQLEGVDTTSLMEKYKEELINRTHYRNLINSLEE